MRIAIAGLSLESASFLPEVLTVADFRATEVEGPTLVERYRGSNTALGGFLAVLEAEGADIVPLLYAEGGAAGCAEDAAFIHYADRIVASLAAVLPVDGVLLHLHGAFATPTRLDPDRELTERVRAIVGRSVPVILALDYHGNLDDSLSAVADGVFGYRLSPHTDQGETGERAARCMVRTVRGEIRPVTAIVKPGVMVPSIASATALRPLADLVAAAAAAGRDDGPVLDVSLFAGFSYADVPNCGFSIVAVADGDRAAAEAAARALSDRVWAARRDLLPRTLWTDLDAGVTEAMNLAVHATRPVVLLEHADRANDSTYVLRALLERGATRAAVPFLWDPEAAAQAASAGVGATVTVRAGGKSSPQAGGPVELNGEVLFAGEKSFKVSGAYSRGKHVDLGTTALLRVGGIIVSLVSIPAFGVDEDPFRIFGLDPMDFRLVVLRSKTHFRAAWETLAERIIIVDTPDWGPADLTTLPFRRVPVEQTFPFNEG
ncbi:M81 family metallopeptidase [Sabulicella rubraurantiaca]|uniref:M81 family metallopeptidase n=1 Tax=Sabulicella rubraurantiaca TaxID=2811429 RepID=UPI001A969B3E|nr:M81 family metallopeptidase [Sabulicella rubraurantiaca]